MYAAQKTPNYRRNPRGTSKDVGWDRGWGFTAMSVRCLSGGAWTTGRAKVIVRRVARHPPRIPHLFCHTLSKTFRNTLAINFSRNTTSFP